MEEEDLKPKKNHRKTVPNKEADLIMVAHSAANAWHNNPELGLTWTTAEQLKCATDRLEESYSVRTDVKGGRSAVAGEMKSINKEIDQSMNFVKGYLAEKYSPEIAPNYYAQFGLIHTKRGYRLPIDQGRRQHALEQMLRGIEQHGLSELRYGKLYWEELLERFTDARHQAVECDSTTSEQVKVKIVERDYIRKALNSLVHLLMAHYPDTWKEELRVWGFQKEKY